MADILEVPIDIENSTEDIQNNTEDNAQVIEDIEEVKPIKAKAKGRPKGSCNRGPPKPRAKKVKIQEEPIDTPAYEPSSPRRNLPIPEFGVNDVAVEMLRLLSNQTQERQQRKRDLYKSWFA